MVLNRAAAGIRRMNMDTILGALILGLLVVIVILQLKGKPLMIHITTTQKFDNPTMVIPPPDTEEVNEQHKPATLDDLVGIIQTTMMGGETDVERK
jgi:hypothetical protein